MLPLQALTRALKNSPRLEFGSFTDSRIFKLSIGVIFLMLVSFQTFGQEDWTLLKEEAGVKVYYQIVGCNSESDASDPLNMPEIEPDMDRMNLRIVNEGSNLISVKYSQVIRTNDDSVFETVSVNSGTTLITSCDTAPKVVLTKQHGDGYPISVEDFLSAFVITINQ